MAQRPTPFENYVGLSCGLGWHDSTALSPRPLARLHPAGAGRRPQTITPSLLAYAVVAPNVTQVEELLRSKLARYMALQGTSAEWWDRRGLDHPFGRDFGGYADVLAEAIDGDFVDAAIDRVPPELVRSCSMSGTPRQVEATIRDYADAGLRHIVLVPASALISSRNQAYVAWALPRLARALRR